MTYNKLVLLLLITLSLASCSGNTEPQQGIKSGLYYDSQDEKTDEVWICTGKSSHAYHCSIKCRGMQACRSNRKKVSKQIAIDMGRTPCHYCYKNE